jgi:hypothetical protein
VISTKRLCGMQNSGCRSPRPFSNLGLDITKYSSYPLNGSETLDNLRLLAFEKVTFRTFELLFL